jgi:hypothetical protein
MEPSCRIVDIRSFYADCVSFALGGFFSTGYADVSLVAFLQMKRVVFGGLLLVGLFAVICDGFLF